MPKLLFSVLPGLTLIVSILLSYLLDRFFPLLEIIPSPFDSLGWLVIGAGAGLAFYSAFLLMRKRTTPDPGGTPSLLVMSGPYSFSRNPAYTGDLLVVTGAAIVFGSLTAFAGPVLFFAVINWMVIPVEERKLLLTFGPEYDHYRQETRKWI